MGWHPQAGKLGPYDAMKVTLGRIGQRLRVLEGRPPAGMATAVRIDTPPPSTSSATTTPLWRLAAPPAGTSALIGVDVRLTGTATGTVSVSSQDGEVLDRVDAPVVADLGPYPCDAGVLTVSGWRTGGTGTVVVDVIGCRYGPVLVDDTTSDDGTEQEVIDVSDTPAGDVTTE